MGEAAWRAFLDVSEALTLEDLESLSPMVILSPHPDDETLGCGGLIWSAAQRDLRPRVVYLTDGRASHPGSRLWPPERIALERRSEALGALRVLGVPPKDVLFLDWPDATPFAAGDPAYSKSLMQLTRWLQPVSPVSLWAPWRHEHHRDHVAAAGLADTLCITFNKLRRFDYLVWGWRTIDPALAHGRPRALITPAAGEVRRRALACHRTQTTDLISDALEGFRIPNELAALCDRWPDIFLEHP